MMIYVYDKNENVVASVRYNNNLDFWNGEFLSCGIKDMHKGLTKLEDGRYVLIYGSNVVNSKNVAEVVSDYQAYKEIMLSGSIELFLQDRFKDLLKFNQEPRKENLVKEVEN